MSGNRPAVGHPGGIATLPGLLLEQAARRPHQPALRHKQFGIWRTWTWRDVHHEVAQVARSLSARAIGVGHCVGVWADAHPDSVFSALGALASGASVLPIASDADTPWLARALSEIEVAAVMARTPDQAEAVLAAAPAARKPLVAVSALDDSGTPEDAGAPVSYRRFVQGDVVTGPSLQELGRAIASLEGTGIAFHYFPADAGRRWCRTSVDHARLLGAAEAAVWRDGVRTDDEVLADAGLWFLPLVHLVLVQWLLTGNRLNLPERPETAGIDRREIGPTLLYARAAWFDELVAETAQRFGAGMSWRRRWLEATVPVPERAGLPGQTAARPDLLARLVLLRPLRDVLGLSRVRLAVCADAQLSALAHRFLDTLRVPISPLSAHQAVQHAAADGQRFGRDAIPDRSEHQGVPELLPGQPLGATL